MEIIPPQSGHAAGWWSLMISLPPQSCWLITDTHTHTHSSACRSHLLFINASFFPSSLAAAEPRWSRLTFVTGCYRHLSAPLPAPPRPPDTRSQSNLFCLLSSSLASALFIQSACEPVRGRRGAPQRSASICSRLRRITSNGSESESSCEAAI